MEVDDWESNQPLVTVFVRGGDSTYVDLPLGRYRLIVSAGLTWFGYDNMFGLGARIEDTVEPIFLYEQDGTVVGSKFYLQRTPRRNMPMKPDTIYSDR